MEWEGGEQEQSALSVIKTTKRIQISFSFYHTSQLRNDREGRRQRANANSTTLTQRSRKNPKKKKTELAQTNSNKKFNKEKRTKKKY